MYFRCKRQYTIQMHINMNIDDNTQSLFVQNEHENCSFNMYVSQVHKGIFCRYRSSYELNLNFFFVPCRWYRYKKKCRAVFCYYKQKTTFIFNIINEILKLLYELNMLSYQEQILRLNLACANISPCMETFTDNSACHIN